MLNELMNFLKYCLVSSLILATCHRAIMVGGRWLVTSQGLNLMYKVHLGNLGNFTEKYNFYKVHVRHLEQMSET